MSDRCTAAGWNKNLQSLGPLWNTLNIHGLHTNTHTHIVAPVLSVQKQIFYYTCAIYIKFRCYGAAGMATIETAPMHQQLSLYAHVLYLHHTAALILQFRFITSFCFYIFNVF